MLSTQVGVDFEDMRLVKAPISDGRSRVWTSREIGEVRSWFDGALPWRPTLKKTAQFGLKICS